MTLLSKNILFILVFILSTPLMGSDSTKSTACKYKYNNYYDAAINVGSGEFAGALSWSHLHGFGKKKQRFKIGYGIRLTSYAGANKYYTTAPSSLTSTSQSLATIFSDDIKENIDTLAFQSPQSNMLNASINIQYSVGKRIDIGFNIDAIGFSFGGTRTANIISSIYDPGQSPITDAQPTKFNLLLTSDNDRGSLNSELFLRYWLSDKIAIRAGYTFLFTEYTATHNLSFDQGRISNDRYRHKSSMFMLGISWRPFVKNII